MPCNIGFTSGDRTESDSLTQWGWPRKISRNLRYVPNNPKVTAKDVSFACDNICGHGSSAQKTQHDCSGLKPSGFHNSLIFLGSIALTWLPLHAALQRPPARRACIYQSPHLKTQRSAVTQYSKYQSKSKFKGSVVCKMILFQTRRLLKSGSAHFLH